MRLIGTLPSETDARRLGDYLLTHGMRNRVEAGSRGDWQLWIEHDDHVDQATAQYRQFTANPVDPRYVEAAPAARQVRKQETRESDQRRRNFTDVRTSWAALPHGGMVVTMSVAALCVVVYVFEQTRFADELFRWMLFYVPRGERTFGLRDAFAQISQGQLWRLFTPALLHANLGHIFFNVWAFVNVGGMIEVRKGRGTMLAIVLLGAAISSSAQAFWDGVTPGGGVGFVGLSGVVYAAFGFAWIRGRVSPQERVGLHPQTVGLMLGWLVLCITGLLGPIANAAHVVGLAVGSAIGAWPLVARKMRR